MSLFFLQKITTPDVLYEEVVEVSERLVLQQEGSLSKPGCKTLESQSHMQVNFFKGFLKL